MKTLRTFVLMLLASAALMTACSSPLRVPDNQPRPQPPIAPPN